MTRNTYDTRRNEPRTEYTTREQDLYGLLPPSESTRQLNHHMVLHLRLDRESFDTLKELLRKKTTRASTADESAASRRDREALNRVLDQIRDVKYPNV